MKIIQAVKINLFFILITSCILLAEDTTYLPNIDSFNAYKTREQKYSNFNVIEFDIINTNDSIIEKNSNNPGNHKNQNPSELINPTWNNSICIDSYNDYYFTDNFSFLSSINFLKSTHV